MIIAIDGPFGTGKSTTFKFLKESKCIERLLENSESIKFIAFTEDSFREEIDETTKKIIDILAKNQEFASRNSGASNITLNQEMLLYLCLFIKEVFDDNKIYIIEGYVFKILSECSSQYLSKDSIIDILNTLKIRIPELQIVFSHKDKTKGNPNINEEYNRTIRKFENNKEITIKEIKISITPGSEDKDYDAVKETFEAIKGFLSNNGKITDNALTDTELTDTELQILNRIHIIAEINYNIKLLKKEYYNHNAPQETRDLISRLIGEGHSLRDQISENRCDNMKECLKKWCKKINELKG